MNIEHFQTIDLARAYGDLRHAQIHLERVIDSYDIERSEEAALRAALQVLAKNLAQLGAAIHRAVLQ